MSKVVLLSLRQNYYQIIIIAIVTTTTKYLIIPSTKGMGSHSDITEYNSLPINYNYYRRLPQQI